MHESRGTLKIELYRRRYINACPSVPEASRENLPQFPSSSSLGRYRVSILLLGGVVCTKVFSIGKHQRRFEITQFGRLIQVLQDGGGGLCSRNLERGNSARRLSRRLVLKSDPSAPSAHFLFSSHSFVQKLRIVCREALEPVALSSLTYYLTPEGYQDVLLSS